MEGGYVLVTQKKSWIFRCEILLIITLLSFTFVSCASSTGKYHLRIVADTGGSIPGGSEEFINGDYKKGTIISISAREFSGYYFVKWTSSNGGSFKDKNNSVTKFTMPGNDTIITAHFSLKKN